MIDMNETDSKFLDSMLVPLDEYPLDRIKTASERNRINFAMDVINAFSKGQLKTYLKLGYEFFLFDIQLIDSFTNEFKFLDSKKKKFTKDLFDVVYFNVLSNFFHTADNNTGAPNYIPNEVVNSFIHEKPEICITRIDKALFGLITYISNNLESEKSMFREPVNAIPTLIMFFNIIQKYECETRRTIDYENSDDTNLTNLLFSSSCEDEDGLMLVDLSDTDYENVKNAVEFKKRLNKLIDEEIQKESDYIHEPGNDECWREYVELINYRSVEERRVVSLIKQRIPIEDKKNEFESYLKGLIAPNRFFHDKKYNKEELVNRFKDRLVNASNYMWVRKQDGSLINLFDSLLLATYPISFNSVLIAYHLYLLEPNQLNAMYFLIIQYFFTLVTLYSDEIPDDFEFEAPSLINSIYEMINDFFIKHRSTIDTLASRYYEQYKYIQSETTEALFCLSDSVVFRGVERILNRENQISKELNRVFVESGFRNRVIERYLSTGELIITEGDREQLRQPISELKNGSFKDQLDWEQVLEDEKSRQLIVSVNAIYLFVEFLRKMLKSDVDYIGSKADIQLMMSRLSKIERYLVNTTYITPYIDCFDNEDIKEYRERKGIDSSDIEISNIQLRDVSLLNLTRNVLADLHERVNTSSTLVEINEIKSGFRESLIGYSEGEMKEIVQKLVDDESDYISTKLIELNRSVDEFDKEIVKINERFTPQAHILPLQSIESLSTAELLFNKYANDEYSDKGFDYSCISALYYQAVESIYNCLIWGPYATKLNEIKYRKGIKTPIKNGKIAIEYKGYLPDIFKVQLDKDNTFPMNITIGSFVYILYNITVVNEGAELIHFKSFCDGVFGKINWDKKSPEYLSYKRKLDVLYSLLKEATDPRNNASHGGTIITLSDCQYDRRMVLDKIDLMRKDFFGIIDLFLSLYQ